MTAHSETAYITSLLRLLATGYVVDPEQTLGDMLKGLAHPCDTGWVLSYQLLSQRLFLSNDQELVLACLGLLPPVRQAWSVIMAARCKEAGQISDQTSLQELVSALGAASEWVFAALPQAQLTATAYAGIERELLGVSAEQSAATPMLARILLVCFALQKFQNVALPMLPAIDDSGMQADQNWIVGRLLALPGYQVESRYLLSAELDTVSTKANVAGVLASPWALVLAMLVYAQYNWAAEGSGGLLLESAGGQNAFQPAEITVLVQGADGDEIRCGTLAELVLRTLAYLQVQYFPHKPSIANLNSMLAGMVCQMLKQQIWRYLDGASGQNGQYLIHPDFADACYRLPASKVFHRTGKHIWRSIRSVAEQWRNELRGNELRSNKP